MIYNLSMEDKISLNFVVEKKVDRQKNLMNFKKLSLKNKKNMNLYMRNNHANLKKMMTTFMSRLMHLINHQIISSQSVANIKLYLYGIFVIIKW